MASTDAIAAKTHLFWSRTCSWSKQMRSLRRLRPCCHEIQSIEQLISRKVVYPTTVRGFGPRVSPAYFKLTAWIAARDRRVCPWTYAYTLAASTINMRISSKTLSTSSLTINAPLIVKDEVDKSFRTFPFQNKKSSCGLKAYCYLGPRLSRALEGPRTGWVHDPILIRIVII